MLFDLIRKAGTPNAAAIALSQPAPHLLPATTEFSTGLRPTFRVSAASRSAVRLNYNDLTYEANLAKQNIMVLVDYLTMAPGGAVHAAGRDQHQVPEIPNALVFTYVNANQLRPDQALGYPLVGAVSH